VLKIVAPKVNVTLSIEEDEEEEEIDEQIAVE